jgi:hypothetical protein
VLAGVVADVKDKPGSSDPIDELRVIAETLFDAMVDRPWLGAQFMYDAFFQGNFLRIYEELGQRTLRLDLTPRQRFHAVSAIVSAVIGNASGLGQEPPQEVLDGTVDRDEFLGRYAKTWRGLDAEEYPFVQNIVDEFDGHDDKEQFLAALDLTLAGLRLQAGA